MSKEDEERIRSTVNILKQLDKQSLIIIESNAYALKARMEMDMEPEKAAV